MKKIIICVLVLSLTGLLFSSFKSNSSSLIVYENGKAKGPIIEFKNESLDYGKIAECSNGTREIKFKNKGNEPLIISNVRSSCGCLKVTFNSDPIKPGDEGVIIVKYETCRIGIIAKIITIESNSSISSITYKVTGEVAN